MTEEEMERICAGLTTKSEKIRRLGAVGVTKGDIARYLGVRYQFVYNVLKVAEQPSALDQSLPTAQVEALSIAEALTIAEAKRRLALTFGVDPSAIRITVEG